MIRKWYFQILTQKGRSEYYGLSWAGKPQKWALIHRGEVLQALIDSIIILEIFMFQGQCKNG
jgi:hypothetical protein